ncbi:hypothetical protein [Bacillus sp. B15-48]|uniref:hypothetical protein n=1 Tax=Bacillus sp. B15-48 TaxID=1548601 RepID=UPI00193ED247|nr:hypothetical protein [Bacillus sp. B15-48]MBM4765215.1 hypothetical protein [Bacillus sp. B15-48]
MSQQHYFWNGNMYGENRQPPHAQGWAVPETTTHTAIKKGNVCAYVPGTPVKYHKLNIMHWPSQDYQVPHPKGFLHTQLTNQDYGQQYVPHHRYPDPITFDAPPVPPQF